MSGKLYANIYAGFILLKKQAQVLKIEIECPPFVRKICFIQEHRQRANNYCQRKKVVGAAYFSFHICRYIEEMMSVNFVNN